MTGQILTPFPALTTPLAYQSGNALSAAVAQIQNLDNRETLAFEVVALTYSLHTDGGTDYRNNHAQLRQNAQTFLGATRTLTFLDGSNSGTKMEAAIAWNAAYQADNSIGKDVQAIVVAMGALRETTEYDLWHMILFLRYARSLLGH